MIKLSGFTVKLKLLILPFFLGALLTFFICYAFRWVVDFHWHLPNLKEDAYGFFIPLLVSALFSIFYLNKRLKILNIVNKRDGAYTFYSVVTIMLMAAPTFVGQLYLEDISSPLITIKTADSLPHYSHKRYFNIEHYEVATQKLVSYFYTYMSSSRYDRQLVFKLYLAAPLYSQLDSTTRTPIAWFAKVYYKEADTPLSDSEKMKIAQRFVKKSLADFQNASTQEVAYFKNLTISSDRDGFTAAIKTKYKFKNANNFFLLEPNTSSLAQNTTRDKVGMYTTSVIVALVFFLICLFPSVNKENLNNLHRKKTDNDDSVLKFLLNVLTPQKNYVCTPILININILIFFCMSWFGGVNFFHPIPEQLISWGALSQELFRQGEYWRLFSYMFIHYGIAHLFINMAVLAFVGYVLEPYIKPVIYISCYLLCGLAEGLFFVHFYPNLFVGASGAIFGLTGIACALFILGVFDDISRTLFMILIPTIIVSFIITLLITNGKLIHIGGFICGILLGLVYGGYYRKYSKANS